MDLDWQLVGTLVASTSALAGAPLTAIVFYVRAIRDEQRAVHAHMAGRIERIEAECRHMASSVGEFGRVYTSRAEWGRETMLARRQLERLTELMARIQAELESSRALATQFVRATNAIIGLTEQLARRLSPDARSAPHK